MKEKLVCRDCEKEMKNGHKIKGGYLCNDCYLENFNMELDERTRKDKAYNKNKGG